MRYTLNDAGYIETISFLHVVECNNKTCTEYIGTIPEGYSSLAEWSENAVIQAYKIVDGNLVYDADKENQLITQWENTPSFFAKQTDLDALSEEVEILDEKVVQFGWKFETIQGDLVYCDEAIGSLEDLNTTEQSNLVGAINEVNDRTKPNMISAGISTNTSYTISSTWAYAPMTLDNLISSVGDKLTLENGSIKVGAGVSKVELSANFLLRGIKGLMVAGIMVNGSIKPQIYCTPETATTWETRTISNLVFDVNEGDVITLGYGSGATGAMEFAGLFFTFLTVKALD